MMHLRINSLCLFFVAVLIAFGMCCQTSEKIKPKQSASKKNSGTKQAASSNDNLISIKVDGISVRIELAQTPKEQEQGLMFREHLPENQGMLFVYPYPQTLSFWMRNTFIPLDIAFIDHKGMIVSIQQMQPLEEEKSYVSPVPAQYALEMNQGWFARNNVHVGDQVDF